jgi:hypothetical protein
MKKVFLIATTLLLYFSTNLWAKSLGAHVHGLVNLDIAIDNKQMLVMLKTPSESFLGFEYKAKTAKERLLVEQVKTDWNKNILHYLGKNNLKDCKVASSEWRQEFNGKYHSNIVAEAYIDCIKPLKKRPLSISFKQSYKNVLSIDLQLLREDGSVVNKTFNVEKIKINL